MPRAPRTGCAAGAKRLSVQDAPTTRACKPVCACTNSSKPICEWPCPRSPRREPRLHLNTL
eukprot:11195386-Lingulodinium_polyedra.AAC.1